MTESENLAARVFWRMGLIPNMTSNAATGNATATEAGSPFPRSFDTEPDCCAACVRPRARWLGRAALMRCSITKGSVPFLPTSHLFSALPPSMYRDWLESVPVVLSKRRADYSRNRGAFLSRVPYANVIMRKEPERRERCGNLPRVT